MVFRNERRDCSIFRIGWNVAERLLVNNLAHGELVMRCLLISACDIKLSGG